MNKSQLVDAIARNAKITKVDAKKALDAFIEVTGETLRSGDKIVLVGFGSFSVVGTKAGGLRKRAVCFLFAGLSFPKK